MPLYSIEYASARSLQWHSGKKRSDYDDFEYPRSRTSPGWFTSSTGLPMSSVDTVIHSVAGMEPYRSATDSRKK